jgi:hypothetical protein
MERIAKRGCGYGCRGGRGGVWVQGRKGLGGGEAVDVLEMEGEARDERVSIFGVMRLE